MTEHVYDMACVLLKAVEDEGLQDRILFGDWLSHLQDQVNEYTTVYNPD